MYRASQKRPPMAASGPGRIYRCASYLVPNHSGSFSSVAVWPASAADTESASARQVYDIDDVVVSANKFPGRIQVITASEIEAMSFERVDELLQHVTGILSQRTDGIFEMSPIVTMRGLGGNVPGRTLVLLDGQPVSTGDIGNMR